MRHVVILFAIVAGLARPAAGASTAGITTPGTTAYPNAGMRRLSKLILSTNLYASMYAAVIDRANGFGYFTTAGAIDPGYVIKVDLRGPVPVELGAVACRSGELNLDAGVIDTAAGFAYFGTTTSPGKIVKIGLGLGTNAPTYVDSLTLSNQENLPWGAVIDDNDPNPTNHYAYFGCGTSPGRVVKLALGTFKEIGSVQLASSENGIRRGVIDAANGYAYFAGPGLSGGTNFPTVVKIALGAGASPPARVGAITLDFVRHDGIGSAVIDGTTGSACFGTYLTNVPARVYKVALDAGANPPTLLQTLTLNPNERELCSAVIDPFSGCALFGTDHTYPAKIYKVKGSTGNSAASEAGSLQLMAGTCAPGCYPPDGANILNTNPVLYGELFLQSAVIDPEQGYAWFGCDSHPGQVVKVAFSQQGALKATRVTLVETAYVSEVCFYSHAATGDARLPIYDDASPQNLLWQSDSVPNTASDAWLSVLVLSGLPATLTLAPGAYWLAWQVDTTVDVASYAPGPNGAGLLLNQAYGTFPASLGGEQSSAETWSLYFTYNTTPPPRPLFDNFGFLSNSGFGGQLSAAPGYAFRLQASTNLSDWSFIGGGIADTNGLLLFQDLNPSNFAQRFYRPVWP
jgi:hypothetical protein